MKAEKYFDQKCKQNQEHKDKVQLPKQNLEC